MVPLLTLSLVGLFVVIVLLEALWRNAIRVRHPETWKALGSPTLILNNSIANSLRMERFLWRGEYRVLGDRGLNRLAASIKIAFVVYGAVFAAMILAQL